MMTTMTYVVADGEYVGELFRDVGMIARHERRIADNAQRHEQIDKRIHDEQLDIVREPIPVWCTLPVEQQLVDLIQHFLLPRPVVFHLKRFCDPPQKQSKLSWQFPILIGNYSYMHARAICLSL